MPSRVFDGADVTAEAPTRSTVTCLEGKAMSSGISIHWRMRSSCGTTKLPLLADAELADHGGMRTPQHAHDLAVGLAIALNAADFDDHAVAVHGAGRGTSLGM